MFQLNTFHFCFDYSQRRRLFSLPNICGSNHDLIIRTRDLSQSIPLPLILRESERSFSSLNLFIWNLGSSTSFLFTFTYFFFFFIDFYWIFIFDFEYFIEYEYSIHIFPSLFLYHSLSPIGLILSNLTPFLIERRVRNKSDWFFDQKYLCEIFGFFLFLYPIGTVFESIENLILLYESILFHSNSFPIPPKENLELDLKLTG